MPHSGTGRHHPLFLGASVVFFTSFARLESLPDPLPALSRCIAFEASDFCASLATGRLARVSLSGGLVVTESRIGRAESAGAGSLCSLGSSTWVPAGAGGMSRFAAGTPCDVGCGSAAGALRGDGSCAGAALEGVVVGRGGSTGSMTGRAARFGEISGPLDVGEAGGAGGVGVDAVGGAGGVGTARAGRCDSAGCRSSVAVGRSGGSVTFVRSRRGSRSLGGIAGSPPAGREPPLPPGSSTEGVVAGRDGRLSPTCTGCVEAASG